MLNSFKVDFSGQSIKVCQQIENVGQIVKNNSSTVETLPTEINEQNHKKSIKNIKQSIC